MLLVVVVGSIIYLVSTLFPREDVKFVAYVGRYTNPAFDQLHEVALRHYLGILSNELPGVRLELKSFNVHDDPTDMRAVYDETLPSDPRFILAIDNTWGKNLQPVAPIIRREGIPVISINANKQDAFFEGTTLFLGHDDTVPAEVSAFVSKILRPEKIVLITEADYALSEKFDHDLPDNDLTVWDRLEVATSEITEPERESILQRLDLSLKDASGAGLTVILNTHATWGAELIKEMQNRYRGVTIIGGPYVVSLADLPELRANSGSNRLILLTNPSDTMSETIHRDLHLLKSQHPELFGTALNTVLFLKRCRDAVSILRSAIAKRDGEDASSTLDKQTLLGYFRSLAGRSVVTKDELYRFDPELRLVREVTFEETSGTTTSSYGQQLNGDKEAIPNIFFGLDIIGVSNVDVETRSFHSDFYYWLRYDERFEGAEDALSFSNQIRQLSKTPVLSRTRDGQIFKLYKVSADFNTGFDLRRFPFDRQQLSIRVEIVNPSEDVRISFDHESFDRSRENIADFNLGPWTLKDYYITVDNLIAASLRGTGFRDEESPKTFKVLSVRLEISRKFWGPFITIGLPLLMIALAAISLLYVEDLSFGNIGDAAVGIFMSIITYSIAFKQLTPPTSVLTRADLLFYFTFLTVLAVFLLVILVNASGARTRTGLFVRGNAVFMGHGLIGLYFVATFLVLLSGR